MSERVWRVEEDVPPGTYALVDERNVTLCRFEPQQLLDCEVTFEDAREAATLAAAAPDLARELAQLQCRACGYRIGEERPGSDRCACTDARAALAKAEGK